MKKLWSSEIKNEWKNYDQVKLKMNEKNYDQVKLKMNEKTIIKWK